MGNLSCLEPPAGYEYYVDVYSVNLVGPGPHDLVADTCDSPQADGMLYLYQDDQGSAAPLDLDNACPHLVAMDDAACGVLSGWARIRASGLAAGTVQVVVTTFGTTASAPAPYDLKLISDTSCPQGQ
jgi:hypothetical protein